MKEKTKHEKFVGQRKKIAWRKEKWFACEILIAYQKDMNQNGTLTSNNNNK